MTKINMKKNLFINLNFFNEFKNSLNLNQINLNQVNQDLNIFEKHLNIKLILEPKININNENSIQLNVWNLLKDNFCMLNMLLKGVIFASIFYLIIYNITKTNDIDHHKYYAQYEHDKYDKYNKYNFSRNALVWIYLNKFFDLVRKYGFELGLILFLIWLLSVEYRMWIIFKKLFKLALDNEQDRLEQLSLKDMVKSIVEYLTK